jgi:dolichol-phosphate mannosyltransferase
MSGMGGMSGSEPTDRPELSVVMPVYNEGGSIEPVLRALEKAITADHETLVVYDFDEDNTIPVVQALQSELPDVRLARNTIGRGVLNALKSGFQQARGELVLVTMADGSDEVQVIDDMIAAARGGAAVVAGSRYMAGGGQIGGPKLKSAMSRVAGLTLHWIGRMPVHDATNNFKLYRRDFLDSVTIESEAGFELALELTVKAHLRGLPMAEVPTTWRDRTAGESRFDLRKWLPHYLKWYVRGITAPVASRKNKP